jgi:hypothetical protein
MTLCALVPGSAAAGDIFSVLLGGAKDSPVAASAKVPTGTHETSKIVDVKGETKAIKLQTLAAGPDGMVYALLGSDRYGPKVSSGEVQVFDSTGEKVRGWKIDFQCQAINCASDGTVFVAGDGKLATFDAAGQVKSAPTDLPFIQRALADAEALRKKAEEQRSSEIQSYEEMVKDVEKQLADLKKKDEEKLNKVEKQQMMQFEAMITSYKRALDGSKKKKPEEYVNQIVSRVRIINSIAATEKDLYVVCGELQGFGYAVWRMDRSFENAKQVMSGLRGCCGQMDVQCCGDDLIVAQNCEHNVGRYDRDGKKLGTLGRRAGREGSDDGFTGCCNPMNVRADADGRVYTAESEGIVRVFDKDGKAQGILGSVKITGGCKNVAIALSKDGNTVFFCDQPASKIHVMTRKPDSAKGAN